MERNYSPCQFRKCWSVGLFYVNISILNISFLRKYKRALISR
jgi:hypothetical protein